jgi:hypothetical protein
MLPKKRYALFIGVFRYFAPSYLFRITKFINVAKKTNPEYKFYDFYLFVVKFSLILQRIKNDHLFSWIFLKKILFLAQLLTFKIWMLTDIS